MHVMVMIDTIIFKIVGGRGGLLKPLPQIVNCLKYPGSERVNDLIQAVMTSDDYLLQHNKPETTFNFISVNEVYIDNIINKLKNKSSSGYDTISNKYIKCARNVLTSPVTLLIKSM